jgi:hypothetical protein
MESLLFFDKAAVLESYTNRSRKNVIFITNWAIRRLPPQGQKVATMD